MMAFLASLFGRAEPRLSAAGPRDAADFAAIHAKAFRRGWSDTEFEQLLTDRTVLAHRVVVGRSTTGFILSRSGGDEAEILSVAVSEAQRGRGLGALLVDRHLRTLAGRGVRAVFLEVEEDNEPARRLYARYGFDEVGRRPNYYANTDGAASHALVLRRDLI